MSFRRVRDLIIVTKILKENQLSDVREGSIITTIDDTEITDDIKLYKIITNAQKYITITFKVPPPPPSLQIKTTDRGVNYI